MRGKKGRRLKKLRKTKNNMKTSGFLRNLSITNWILIINIALFFLFYILIAVNKSFIDFIALQPASILQGKYLWTLLASMFMHASISHLLVNMISLFFMGNFLEKIIGRKRYLLFYFISGLVASLFFIFLSFVFKDDMAKYAVGASGALFGIGGLLAVLIPKLPVLVFFIIPMPLWIAIVILMFGVWIISYFTGLPIGNTAHLGGLVAGLIYGFYLRRKYKKKVKLLNRYLR